MLGRELCWHWHGSRPSGQYTGSACDPDIWKPDGPSSRLRLPDRPRGAPVLLVVMIRASAEAPSWKLRIHIQ
jgi:hypothetical protein